VVTDEETDELTDGDEESEEWHDLPECPPGRVKCDSCPNVHLCIKWVEETSE